MNRLIHAPLHFVLYGLFAVALTLGGCGGGGGSGTGTAGVASSSKVIVSSSTASSVSKSSDASPLDTIKITLDSLPPSMDMSNEARTKAIQDFDDILWATDETQATPREVIDYYKSRIAKVATEMQSPVQSGFRVWNLYNHGFIVKTPTTTFAFDLVEGKYGWNDVELPPAILDQISALFISHEHGDHYDETEKIPSYIKNHGGAVVYPKLATPKNSVTLLVDGYETIQIKDLTVNTYTGEHNVPVLIYEVITAEGYKIVHTGDNQDSLYLPELDNIHVLLLNGWVNESGNASAINLDGMKNSLLWMKPDVMIPGHFEELGHHRFDRTGRYRYTEGLILQNDTTQKSKTIVLTWGEKLDYTGSLCASPLVKIYDSCSMPLPKTAVEFKILFYKELPIGDRYIPSGVAEDEKSVWISNDASGGSEKIIYQYDKSNGKLLGSIPTPSQWARHLTFDGTDLWLIDYIDGQKFFRLSRENGEILSAIPFDLYSNPFFTSGLAASADFLYLAVSIDNLNTGEFGSKIYKVDKKTGALLAVVYESAIHKISGLALANNSLWFTSFHAQPETVTGHISKLTNISLSGEVLSTKDISFNFIHDLSPGLDYLLYIDGNKLGKVQIP